jgi:hypothetical protein
MAAGHGGAITIAEDRDHVSLRTGAADMTSRSEHRMLFVPADTTHALDGGFHSFSDVVVAGTLELRGNADLAVRGTLYVAQFGKVLARHANGVDGGAVLVSTRGSPVVLGRIDSSGQHAPGAGVRGGNGGLVDIRSSALQHALVPTLLTRGGNARTAMPVELGTGGTGWTIILHAGNGRLMIGGGAGQHAGVPPFFREGFPADLAPPSYAGFDLLPPAPFNMSSGDEARVAGVRTPLRKIDAQAGFTRGLLTSGGMGAFGEPAGAGGKGGDIHLTGSAAARITFRDIDIVTGADVESLHADIFLTDGIQHRYVGATGSMGGKGTAVAAASRHGGAGGAAGHVRLAGPVLLPAQTGSFRLWQINGFGQPNGPLRPLSSDIMFSTMFAIGHSVQVAGANGVKLYRLRLDSAGTGLAGGSGGIPGGSPSVFPGRFGIQGSSGNLTGLPK